MLLVGLMAWRLDALIESGAVLRCFYGTAAFSSVRRSPRYDPTPKSTNATTIAVTPQAITLLGIIDATQRATLRHVSRSQCCKPYPTPISVTANSAPKKCSIDAMYPYVSIVPAMATWIGAT